MWFHTMEFFQQFPLKIMAMAFPIHYFHAFFLLLFFLSRLQFSLSNSGSMGINYGHLADDIPSPSQVVQLLKAQGITKAKVFDTDTTVLSASAFSISNISLSGFRTISFSNAASSQSFNDTWVQSIYHSLLLLDSYQCYCHQKHLRIRRIIPSSSYPP